MLAALLAGSALALASQACGHSAPHGDAGGAGGAGASSSSNTMSGSTMSGSTMSGSTMSGSTVNGTGGATTAGGWVPPPKVIVPPLPPPPDYSSYPVDGMNDPILNAGSDLYVVPAPPDALTARDLCADLISNCFAPGTRSLDACMLSAPRCQTSQPWTESSPCCADACWSAYAALRTAGTDPLTAYLRVLYKSPICMPGVDAAFGGEP